MKPTIPRKFPYPLLQAVRDTQAQLHRDYFFGQQTNLAAGRRHAIQASLQRFSLQRIIKRLEGRC